MTNPERPEPLAIVGTACRFPGGIVDLAGLWSALSAERDLVTEIPADRFDSHRFVDERGPRAGKSYTRAAGVLEDLTGFDAEFFRIPAREAAQMDPQQRILLETATETLDDAAIAPGGLAGSDTGVFLGMSEHGYAKLLQTDPKNSGPYSGTGSAGSIAANRISHQFDFRGPSMTVDTACSSSLTALHRGARAVATGECGMALCGGVQVLLDPNLLVSFAQASMLSPTGRCRTFSADADGFVRAEGGGMVLIKRLSDAVVHGDRVHAVVLGSHTNCDGRTSALMVPGARSQESLLREVYAKSGVDADQLCYLEAHGTGTPVGDPVECAAIGRALAVPRPSERTLPIGSVKTNLGHLEAASGMASLFKAMAVLRNREIPPSLHSSPLNDAIDFDGLRLDPVTKNRSIDCAGQAVVGVNSFGFGGANAHVILGEAETRPTSAPSTDALPVVVSARSAQALGEAVLSTAKRLDEADPAEFYDIAYTATRRRGLHPYRAAVVAEAPQTAARGLRERAERTGTTKATEQGRVAFVFSGNGSQWIGMGADLLTSEPAFLAAVETVDELLRPRLGWSVLRELETTANKSRMTETDVAQPALFAVQLGLVEVLRGRGIDPTAAMGHSVGEVAAAHVAGALDLAGACRVIAERGATQRRTAGLGRMAAVGLPAEQAREMLTGYSRLVLAAINSEQDVTVSGDAGELADLVERLTAREVFVRDLGLEHPFHSPAMDPVRAPLLEGLDGLTAQETNIPLSSTVSGTTIAGTELTADYWWRNVREPVRFSEAVRHLLADGVDTFVEIGPHPVLSTYLRKLTRHAETPVSLVTTLRKNTNGPRAMSTAVSDVIEAGVPLRWENYFPTDGGVVDLPAYPWQREHHWTGDTQRWVRTGGNGRVEHPLLGERMPLAEPAWTGTIEPSRVPWLPDHRVGGSVVLPAAAYVDMTLAAGNRLHRAPVEVLELDILKALVLPDNGPDTQLQLSMSQEDGMLRIASRQEHTDEWEQHVTGQLRRLWTPAPGPVDPAESFDAERERVSGADHYARLTASGIEYGPAFQVLRELHLGTGTAVASYHLPHPQNDHEIHPALLDGGLQATAALLDDAADHHGTFLPSSIDRIRYWRRPAESGYVHARLSSHNERCARLDIVITDEMDVISTEMHGVWLRRFAAGRRETAEHYTTVMRAVPGLEAHALPAPTPNPTDLAVPHERRTDAAEQNTEVWKRISAHYGTAAVQDLLSGSESFSWRDLVNAGVLPKYEPLIELLLETARENRLIEQVDRRQWRVLETATPHSLVRELIREYPEYSSETTLLSYLGHRLTDILRGQVDPVELLFSECRALVEQLYDSGPGGICRSYNQLLRALLRDVVRQWPTDRPLRVLEVGAGSGATTAAVLPILPPERTRYVFTDVSEAFFPRAQQRFAEYDFLEYRVLDLEQDPVDQGFVEGGFDIVIAANVLHATTDVTGSARALARQLTDRGLLFALEIHDSQVCALPFGLLDGFWSFTDTNLRTRSPLLSRAAWSHVLSTSGFSDVAVTGGTGQPANSPASVLVATRSKQDDEQPIPTASMGRQWLVATEDESESDFGRALAERIDEAGGRTCLTTASTEADNWTGIQPSGTTTVVLLLAEPESPGAVDRTVRRAGILRAIARATDQLPESEVNLCLVTRPSGVLPAPEPATTPEDAGAWGTARSLSNEHPALEVRQISLERADTLTESATRLALELLTPSDEREIALTRGGRFAPRLVPTPPSVEQVEDHQRTPYRLEVRDHGLDYRLHWISSSVPEPDAEELVVSVHAVGLNYRDVMQVSGLLSPEAVEGTLTEHGPGCEYAGTVIAVGSRVSDFHIGDPVYGVAPAALRSHITVRAEQTMPLPTGMSFTEAVTLPVAAMTVHHSLDGLAHVKPGETVLVHGAAGGVGLAAIQHARNRGTTVLATAGSPAKRAFLRTLGVEHVFDSRSLSFAAEVLNATDGNGVDVVLNSLAGEAISHSLELLRPYGRFIELGRRDILENNRIALRLLKRNISLHCVDLGTVDEHNRLDTQLPATVTAALTASIDRPLPYTAFPVARIGEAFRFLQHSRHIGKVVVTFTGEVGVEQPETSPELDSQGTYLVTGGLGGAGAATARWLAARGARKLALLSRRGADAPEAAELLAELTDEGVTVHTHRADVTDRDAMRRVIADISAGPYPLRGVVHAAMQLDDAPLVELDETRVRTAVEPKTRGAAVLDELTRDLDLEFFVGFSSMSSLLGQVGQSNYGAGNLFLEALARARRRRGLPGQVVSWGALRGTGYLVRAGVENQLERFGFLPISPRDALDGLGRLLGTDEEVRSVGSVDWGNISGFLPTARSPRLSANLPRFVEGTGQDRDSFVAQLHSLPAEEAFAQLRRTVTELVANVLQTTADRIDETVPLEQLGMDSMMSSELLLAMQNNLGYGPPLMEITRASSVAELARTTFDHLIGASEERR